MSEQEEHERLDATSDTGDEPDWRAFSDEEWRARLGEEQYYVLRQRGTERPFTGRYWNTETAGSYRCAGCGTELFRSDSKYDAGCGWPSFYQAVNEQVIEERPDASHGMRRERAQP